MNGPYSSMSASSSSSTTTTAVAITPVTKETEPREVSKCNFVCRTCGHLTTTCSAYQYCSNGSFASSIGHKLDECKGCHCGIPLQWTTIVINGMRIKTNVIQQCYNGINPKYSHNFSGNMITPNTTCACVDCTSQ